MALRNCRFLLAAYNNTLLTRDPTGGFIVVFEPEATPEERAGWRVRNNVAYAFHDRLSLRNDPRKSKRPFLLPLITEDGAIDRNVLIPAGGESQLFADLTGYDFRPTPGGPLDSTGVEVEGMVKGIEGQPPAIGALEANGSPWKAGASWMNDGLPVPLSPAQAADLARRLRPASLQMGKTDRRYEDQYRQKSRIHN